MRINVINTKYLTDQHLIAEYREMKMITYYYVKSKNTKTGIDKSRISERYTLSKGHAYMWYDKMGYVAKRFKALCKEMDARGFKCDYRELNWSDIDKEAFGDFTVTQEDVRVNLDRVLIRLEKQPFWYKHLRGGYDKNEMSAEEAMRGWRNWYEMLFAQEKLIENYE